MAGSTLRDARALNHFGAHWASAELSLSLPSPKSSNSGAKVASRRLLTKGEGRQEPLGAVHDLFGGEWLLIYIVNGVTPILCQNT